MYELGFEYVYERRDQACKALNDGTAEEEDELLIDRRCNT